VAYWGIWLARNIAKFQDRCMFTFQCASQIRLIFESIKFSPKVQKTRISIHPPINKSMAWWYFNGSSQGRQVVCGKRRTLFMHESHHIKFKVGFGGGVQ
jgi:hypothetical protein